MRWHIKTRSRNKDYRFIGGSSERWWARFAGDTSFERPTLLLESSQAEGWRLQVSAIPSVRKDRYHTQLRYTIVGTGMIDESITDERHAGDVPLGLVRRLIAAWLDEATALLSDEARESGHGGGGALSRALDEAFSESTIEEWFAGDVAAPEIADAAQKQFLGALEQLQATPLRDGDGPSDDSGGEGSEPEPDAWYGSLHSATCREAFLARATELLAGKRQGSAHLLNLADRIEDVSPEIDVSRTAILFDVPASAAATPKPIRRPHLGDAKKKGASSGPAGVARRTASPAPAGDSAEASPRVPALGSGADGADDGDGERSGVDVPDAGALKSTDGSSPPPGDTDETGGASEPDDSDEFGDNAASEAAEMLRRALPSRESVQKVRDASRETLGDVIEVGRDTLEEVLGTSRGTLEEMVGASRGTLGEVFYVGRQTLDALKNEVAGGASQGARDVLGAIVTGTRAIAARADELVQESSDEPEEGDSKADDDDDTGPVADEPTADADNEAPATESPDPPTDESPPDSSKPE